MIITYVFVITHLNTLAKFLGIFVQTLGMKLNERDISLHKNHLHSADDFSIAKCAKK